METGRQGDGETGRMVVSQKPRKGSKNLRMRRDLGGDSKYLIDERDLSHDIPFFHIVNLSLSKGAIGKSWFGIGRSRSIKTKVEKVEV